MRATWYFFEVLSRDESCQHKGFVVIALGIGKSYQRINFAGITKFARVRSGVPRRVACFHCCSDNPSFRPIVASLRLISRRDTRHRFISHFGEQESVLFQLQTYGIPTDDLFAGQDGQVNLDWHHKWLNIVRAREEHRSGPTDDIIIPLRFDVLFGRGKNTREHTGNLRALHLCEMVRPQYEAASKFEKTAIAERIVHAIRDSHGRFLKWEEDGWVEVDTETAREKISHFFRHYRTKQTSFQDQVRSSTKTKRRKSPELNASVSDEIEITRRESKQPYRPYSKGNSNTDFVDISGDSGISTEGDFFFSSE